MADSRTVNHTADQLLPQRSMFCPSPPFHMAIEFTTDQTQLARSSDSNISTNTTPKLPTATEIRLKHLSSMPRSAFLNPFIQAACRKPPQTHQSARNPNSGQNIESLASWQRFSMIRPQSVVEKELDEALERRSKYQEEKLALRKQIRRLERVYARKTKQNRENMRVVRDCKLKLRDLLESEDEETDSGDNADDEMSGSGST